MRPGLKRITATIAGIAAVCVVVFLWRLWREIQVEYHLHRLQDETDYLKEVGSAPERSPERFALDKFLQTDEGKERLFGIYLEVHQDVISKVAEGIGYLAIEGDSFRFVGSGAVPIRKIPQASRWIEPLLLHLLDRTHSSEKYPDRLFKFFHDPDHEYPVLEIRLPENDDRWNPMRTLLPHPHARGGRRKLREF